MIPIANLGAQFMACPSKLSQHSYYSPTLLAKYWARR